MAVLLVGMNSCKYEEGPFISFIPKTERVGNTWIVSTVTIDGTQDTEIDGFKQITFFKEGGCKIIYTAFSVEVAYSGTWAFDDKKEIINIDVTDEAFGTDNVVMHWTILRLKEEELKVTYTYDNKLYVVDFVPLNA